jgi:type II secretory ATPase GspE/PulE/Tfp pilus assembly ATPase PilB-like protein
MDPTEIPTLTKRRLQAQVVGAIYAEMVAQIGQDQARAILDAAIRKAAVANGMNTLAMDGVRKILEGTTTPEEVLRVSKVEDAVA